jgi:alpha-beta hydrolase superfamily lysophospholipase
MTQAAPANPEAFDVPCKDGLSIRGEVYRAVKQVGSVIICHGFKGYAHWAFFPYLAHALADKGLTAVTFDFSGSGIGADRETFTEADAFATNTFSREQEDLEVLVDYLRRRKIITPKFGLFGHSRGGATAIVYTAATDSDVNALVTWAAISYVNRWTEDEARVWRRQGYAEITNSRTGQVMRLGTDLLDDVELHLKTKLNIEAASAKVKVPWLIVHGTADETVPSAEGERLHAASPGVSTLRLIDAASHSFDAKHPLSVIPKNLETAVRETVNFFVRNSAVA